MKVRFFDFWKLEVRPKDRTSSRIKDESEKYLSWRLSSKLDQVGEEGFPRAHQKYMACTTSIPVYHQCTAVYHQCTAMYHKHTSVPQEYQCTANTPLYHKHTSVPPMNCSAVYHHQHIYHRHTHHYRAGIGWKKTILFHCLVFMGSFYIGISISFNLWKSWADRQTDWRECSL